MSIIESLWIINFEGIQFFKFPNHEEDDELIVDFFISLQHFASNMTKNIENEIKFTKIGKFNFYISIDYENKLYFIIKTSKMNIKTKLVNKKLEEIKLTFFLEFKIYLEFIKNKNVKEIYTGIFKSFKEKLIDKIKDNTSVKFIMSL